MLNQRAARKAAVPGLWAAPARALPAPAARGRGGLKAYKGKPAARPAQPAKAPAPSPKEAQPPAQPAPAEPKPQEPAKKDH